MPLYSSTLEQLFDTTPARRRTPVVKLSAMAVAILASGGLFLIAPTTAIAWVSSLLMITVVLFAFEVVDVDIAALSILVLIGLIGVAAPIIGLDGPLVDGRHLFDGFSSNAVISIIAVMIIGAGLDKTGLMSKVASLILRAGGSSEKRAIPLISGTVGVISSFMQNVGAAALFLPVVSRISARSGVPMSRLLMPMGFTAILGGTMTMIGSSPLILLNDLLLTSNRSLPEDQQMATFGLFDVTPVGLALVATGIIYFMIAGRFVLPNKTQHDSSSAQQALSYFQDIYGVDYKAIELVVPKGSGIVGHFIDDVERDFKIRIIATLRNDGVIRFGPGALARDQAIEDNMVMAVLADKDNGMTFAQHFDMKVRREPKTFQEELSPTRSGVAEVVIPPSSSLIGKSARDLWLRKTTGLSLLAIYRDGGVLREGDGVRDVALDSGDTLMVHSSWESLARLRKDPHLLTITTDFPYEEMRPEKVLWAGVSFAIALALVLFTDMRLSAALMTGALGMILSGVLTGEEAYRAVSWRTVFLLASLIPLGLAVDSSGTAAWIATNTLAMLGDVPIWVLQATVAVLATIFTLLMSNVGATVLLVPLAVNIAVAADADPALFALTVAISTSNSFLIPTHQVNALIMGPGGYRVPDFLRAGGIMTILFLVVELAVLNIIF